MGNWLGHFHAMSTAIKAASRQAGRANPLKTALTNFIAIYNLPFGPYRSGAWREKLHMAHNTWDPGNNF